MIRPCRMVVLVLILGLTGGCGPAGPRRNPVAGAVNFKGAPLKEGTISFMSEDGNYLGTAGINDGRYEIAAASGLPAGKYLVAVTSQEGKMPKPEIDEAPGESKPSRERIPPWYNENTELKKEITDGPNEVNFDLK